MLTVYARIYKGIINKGFETEKLMHFEVQIKKVSIRTYYKIVCILMGQLFELVLT